MFKEVKSLKLSNHENYDKDKKDHNEWYINDEKKIYIYITKHRNYPGQDIFP